MPPAPRQRFLVRAALVALAVAGGVAALVLVGVVPPTANSWYPKCAGYQLTGLHCPGCGGTRAVHLALNGRFGEALSQNALAFVGVPLLGLAAARGLWRYLWQLPAPRWRWPNWLTVVVFVVPLLYAVARNIPAEPFTLLAPKELPAAEVGVPEPR